MGTTPEAYNGGRTEADLVEFMNSKAGTHRAPGGGLNAVAGTIEALDTLVAKFTSGSSIAEVAGEVTKAAADLKSRLNTSTQSIMSRSLTSSPRTITMLLRSWLVWTVSLRRAVSPQQSLMSSPARPTSSENSLRRLLASLSCRYSF